LKNARHMLQNNELMKQTDFTEDSSGFVVKEQMRNYRVEDARRVPNLLAKKMIATIANSQGI